VTDYYISYGIAGTEKTREGDRKTPIGVYHITASLHAQSIGDLYGTGAFPINYPNVWDRRHRRGGHGIWLHGKPSDTFSRSPRASDGCVALSNVDIDELAKSIQVGLTPVIISNAIEWVSIDDWQSERNKFRKHIEAWRSDWESLDTERYLRHYSERFQSRTNQTFEQFARHKRQVNAPKEWIKIGVSNLSMFRSPVMLSKPEEELVMVTFDQDYRSSNFNSQMQKRQYWIREDGVWRIIYEGAA